MLIQFGLGSGTLTGVWPWTTGPQTVRTVVRGRGKDRRGRCRYYAETTNRCELLHGRVLLKPEELAKLCSTKLVPGMPVDVFIKTPGRTALSYLIKPLRDQAERAFKEH